MKLIINLLAIFLSIVVIVPGKAQTTFITKGSVWSYYDKGDEPGAQDALQWYDLNYDAVDWDSGTAELGYGDGDEETELDPTTLTAYFRYVFDVAENSDFHNLKFDLTYDDGAVVYLNGVEIRRVNMPEGNIDYNTFASSSVSDNAFRHSTIDNILVDGENILAVEIHQKYVTSSDLSFDFKFWGNPAKIVRGPYLQKLSSSSVLVRWRTATATKSIVDYGTSLSDLNQSEQDLSAKKDHEIEISGLSANTLYYYQIANTRFTLLPADSELYFKTAPEPGTQQSITAWILGDCGTADRNQKAVRDAFYDFSENNPTDMILFLGDNAYKDGTDKEYQEAVFDIYKDKLKNTVSWSCLGNHDGISANSNGQTGPYYDIFSFPTAGESGGVASGTEAYYSFDYGNVHFICLDSYESDRSEGGLMYNWCQDDLQNTSAEWIVAFWHHPPYSKGSHDSDVEDELEEMRQIFLPLLEDYGVDLVLSGHSHSYERSYLLNGHYDRSGTFDILNHTVGATGAGDGKPDGRGAYKKENIGAQGGDGAVYITAGSSGKTSSGPLDHEAIYYSVEEMGSCIMEVNGNQMDVKFIRETGAIEDYFTIIKNDSNCNPGASCDDLNPCTLNEVFDNDCNCVGTYIDDDGDGLCVGQDPDDNDGCNPNYNSFACSPCQVLYSDSFEGRSFGNWKDGGKDCALSAKNANTGSYSVELRDNSGAASSMYACNLDLSAYNEITFDFSYYAVGIEPNEDFFLEISTDGGSSYDSPYAQWILATDFQKNTRYNESITISGVSFTDNTCIRLRVDASGNSDKIYFDDLLIKNCESACTAGEPCDDGDFCTVGDVLDDDCNCTGSYLDADGDGLCFGDDPDDGDGCNPNPDSEASCSCDLIISDDFEVDFGNWNDGGSDCALSGVRSHSGEQSILLRDNVGDESSMFSKELDLSGYTTVVFNFTYYPEGMESGEDFFLEISTDNGDNYSSYTNWVSGEDFLNGTRFHESVVITGITFTSTTRFRIRCDASSNGDQIYIDDIELKGCTTGQELLTLQNRDELSVQESISINSPSSTLNPRANDGIENQNTLIPLEIQLFPNPTKNKLYIDLREIMNSPGSISITALQGISIFKQDFDSYHPGILELDINTIPDGIYFIELTHPEKRFAIKKLIVLED